MNIVSFLIDNRKIEFNDTLNLFLNITIKKLSSITNEIILQTSNPNLFNIDFNNIKFVNF